MKQLKLFDEEEIQLRERLASTLIPTPAYGEATSGMKPGGGSCWAETKVKVLSPEITIVSEVEAFHSAEDSTLASDNRRGSKSLTGSESSAQQQMESVGTRETHNSPRDEVCGIKSGEGKILQKGLWESDKSIVVMKQGNSCGAKGLAVMNWEEKETSSAHRGGQRKSTELSSLSFRARENPRLRFTSLAHYLTVDFLKICFKEMKKDRAVGVDGVTTGEYEENLEENLKELVEKLKRKGYRPQPVRRVYLPKQKGGRRPIGIPAVEDKIVQMAVKKILEAIYEEDFKDVSFGFRPKRSAHNALDKAIMKKPVQFIVDADIEKFFDTVEHKKLMEVLKIRIADRTILRLIGRYLKAGVMEEGKVYFSEKGTPQGGILSPLLANIYLHYCLDEWFEGEVKGKARGYCQLIRYADDFVVVFELEGEAKVFWDELKGRLNGFGLRLSEEKSRVINFGRYPYYKARRQGRRLDTFEFLGFTHYCTKGRKGYFRLGRKTSAERLRRAIKEINEWLKGIRNAVKLKEWWEMLKVKVAGHINYYGISGNIEGVKAYHRRVVSLAYKWINRRSERKSHNWGSFRRFMEENPLPRPRIVKVSYNLGSERGSITEEPCEGKPHARFCEGHLKIPERRL